MFNWPSSGAITGSVDPKKQALEIKETPLFPNTSVNMAVGWSNQVEGLAAYRFKFQRTTPAAPYGWVPIPPQNVSIRLPQGLTPKKVQFLVGATPPAFRYTNGSVELTCPSILDHEVIAIDL